MNKITTALLIALLIAAPKTTVQAARITTPVTTVASTLSLQDVINQHVASITLSEVKAQPTVIVAAVTPTLSSSNPSLKEIAEQLVTQRFGAGHFLAFNAIVQHESSWNPEAVNKSSGACGLGQALPCSKIADHSPVGQLKWMVDYIAMRYGTPTHAWQVWQSQHWY